MATNPRELESNRISGRIVLKETGVGIQDLLVVIYDLDPGTRPEEGFDTAASAPPLAPAAAGAALGDRLGSVLSGADGSWSLEYYDAEFRVLNNTEKRPDLQLMVLAPEDADSDAPPTVLFSSRLTRMNSGRLEAYLIRIPTAQLEAIKIPIPTAADHGEATTVKIQKYRARRTARRALREGVKSVNQDIEAQDLEARKELRKTVEDIVRPTPGALSTQVKFVKDTAPIQPVQEEVFTAGSDYIDSVIAGNPAQPEPGKGMKIHLVLTEKDRQDLQPFKFTFAEQDYYNIPEAEIERLLFKKEGPNSVNSILFANNPISKFCIQKSTEQKCAEEHTGITPAADDSHDDSDPDQEEPPPPPPPGPVAKEDIPLFVGAVLADKGSSQFQNHDYYRGQRPDDKSVQANVDRFSLKKGPADTTAFYDFHSLQIAFQYVWQQLLDETLVNLAERVHNGLETAGKKGLLDYLRDRLAGVQAVGPNLLTASLDDAAGHSWSEVPTEVAAAFDISFIEFDALSEDDKLRLEVIAQDVNARELLPESATYAAVRRDQGERIIDNIRINKPLTTYQLLRDLQEKLLSSYEFTVFAANKDYHSINFGILNTFRQKWEPLCYQAGKLVKTLPLSPKEERKYSVKSTLNMKTTRKQAQKYNSSLQNEVSSVSRAEAEIVAKAQDKSNFNMSVKVDYSRLSSQVGFSKDAQKDTSQAKKDFREAVIKAVQEYKEERSVEVDAEETVNVESTESGTVVNPNDELSMTCLFYELQRRYRVSEQLYRVMPVVLVAQQVPYPNQITEAWVVAHDWIINRALLDDSFRPTLQYLAQKNVGDDFSIRELRKNLRQQRTLVTNLQLEFSKLKKDVENKYAAMERAVRDRIEEEHDKRMYRWWWWTWDQPNQPGEPPDPEMAKALEQAATDEHKYAIEKAEKMALAVQREVNALHQMTLEYNAAMREQLDRLTQIRRLLAHLKNNILYYMQAIWSMEPPDQRYMRLYKVMVPQFEATRTCVVADGPADDIFQAFREPGKSKHAAWLHGKITRNVDGSPKVTYNQLVEVADLDTILGFKGNYMIFPLKQHNALTEFMAAPYVDEAFGAMDPDELSNVNLEEFSKYVCCLHHEDAEKYEELKPVLKAWLERLLADPLRNGDEIVIPTGSMFIELLPSDRSLLEDFKLKHREWDVYKVQAEVRRLELENIRYAARLLNAEMEDPDIERKIVFTGNGPQPLINVDNP